MINDIEMIQMTILHDQERDDKIVVQAENLRENNQKLLDDQRHQQDKLENLKRALDSFNPESDTAFEENIRLLTQEHNKSLQHQLNLMIETEALKNSLSSTTTSFSVPISFAPQQHEEENVEKRLLKEYLRLSFHHHVQIVFFIEMLQEEIIKANKDDTNFYQQLFQLRFENAKRMTILNDMKSSISVFSSHHSDINDVLDRLLNFFKEQIQCLIKINELQNQHSVAPKSQERGACHEAKNTPLKQFTEEVDAFKKKLVQFSENTGSSALVSSITDIDEELNCQSKLIDTTQSILKDQDHPLCQANSAQSIYQLSGIIDVELSKEADS